MKHKHADVLIAIAEGKIVQYKEKEDICWEDADFSVLENNKDPFTFPELEWRIKPELKKDVIVNTSCVHCLADARTIVTQLTREFTYASNLKLTFDGETGKLKKAEVL